MKIAFVGKGGSGKSTLSALFIRYLQSQGRQILAIDADLNMNLAGLLGVAFPEDKVLANSDIAHKLREYLKGNNDLIQDAGKFLPTTPPGRGSNLIRTHNDAALDFCSIDAGHDTRLMTVGTYNKEGIGQHCYHSDLFAAENLLSHIIAHEFDVVCDMVAGTDAFAYSLHLQFDAIILICEPTPESAQVCALYQNLAKEAGIEELIYLVGNKVADTEDLDFIEQQSNMKPLGTIPVLSALKKARQKGEAVQNLPEFSALMEKIEHVARHTKISESQRIAMLYQLHEKLNNKEWVKLAYGDVMQQIDIDFDREKAA